MKHYSEALALVPGIESMDLEHYTEACESIAGCLEELPLQRLFRFATEGAAKVLTTEEAAQFDTMIGKLAESFGGVGDTNLREDLRIERAERTWLVIFMSLTKASLAHEAAENERLGALRELDQENRRKGIHPPDGRAQGKGTDAEAVAAAQKEKRDWEAERKKRPSVLKQLFDFGWDHAQGPREIIERPDSVTV